MQKRFFSYVLPAMLAFAFTGLYTIVDGFFVGQNIGDVGLAGINIAFPIVALIQAVGCGIGMGGAIQISVNKGRGSKDLEDKTFGNTLTLLLLAAVIMSLFVYVLNYHILVLLGAEGKVLITAAKYLSVIALGSIFQLFACGFTPLLRNYDQSILAMAAMICGFVTNIILDWLFVSVLKWGVGGAAWATIIGQIMTVIPCLGFLFKRCRSISIAGFKLSKNVVKNIIRIGLSPFGLTMSPYLVMILINKWAVLYGGETAVAAYAVISYVTSIIFLLLQGVSDGSQPLISLCLGSGNIQEALQIRKLAYVFSLIIALLTGAGILLLSHFIPVLFGASEAVAAMTEKSLPIFVSGFLFVAFCRVTTSYFYATQKNTSAYIMVYGEPILLAILLTAVLPNLLKLQGVWLSAVTAQFILAIIGLILIMCEKKLQL